MRNLLCAIIFFCSLVSTSFTLESCGNGVFKCTSPTTLKICFNGQLVGSEFTCNNSTICCETSETICSTKPDPSCHDYEYDYKDTKLDEVIPQMKVKPGSNLNVVKPGMVNTVCKAQGKFSLSNTNCKNYMLCIESPSGFRGKVMTCYDNKLFDPVSGLCTDSYVCIEHLEATTNAPTSKPDFNSNVATDISNIFDDCINTVSTLRTSTVPVPQLPVCDKMGKFPIPNTGCTKYLYCVKTATGFQEKLYTCPSNSFFNPITARCSVGYICPETSTSTSTSTSASTSISTSTSTTPVPQLPVCDKMGKFPIPNTECTQYLYCVKTSTGFQEKLYKCPSNTFFNPTTARCSTGYVCLERTTTESSNTTDIPNKTTVSVTVSEPIISTSSTSKSPEISITPDSSTPDITTLKPSTTTDSSTSSETTSTQYSTSSAITTPDTTTPDQVSPLSPTIPPEHSTTIDITSISIPSSITPRETTSSLFPITSPSATPSSETSTTSDSTQKVTVTPELTSISSNTPDHITSPELSTIPSITNTPDETTSKPTSTSDPGTLPDSTITYLTTLSSESTTLNPPTTVSTTPSIPTCQAQGKFPIPGSKCKKYLLCLATTSGFWSMQYDCPVGSLFDPSQKLCTVYHQCSELTTQPPTEATTTNSATTELSHCENQGMFPVPNSNCKKYLLCIRTTEGLWGRIYDCLPNTTFDPLVSQCTKTYECVESTSTTTEMAVTTEIPECNRQGRIYISGTGCKQYLLCSLTRSGFMSRVYSCPALSNFNPKDGRCYRDFKCPEAESEPLCSTIGSFPDPQDTNCENYYTCTEVSSNHLEGFKQKCNSGYYFDAKTQVCSKDYICKQELDVQKANSSLARVASFDRCFTVGRWEIQGSKCKDYVLCSANLDGTLKGTKFTCPTTSVFNQVIQKCTSKYICPESACFMPGWIPNPNVNDCSSYISCESSFDNMGNIINTGRVVYCPLGSKFNPVTGCDPTYICPK